jgi:hypothetical protein
MGLFDVGGKFKPRNVAGVKSATEQTRHFKAGA